MYVVSFGDHLGAHEQIEVADVERVEHAFEIMTPAHSITVEAPDARLREHAVKNFLQLFRSGAQEEYVLTAAVSAYFRDRQVIAAVMAFHASRTLVVSHRNGTVAALERLAARTA